MTVMTMMTVFSPVGVGIVITVTIVISVVPIYEVEIGSCFFSSETRDFLLRDASTFSRYADYTL